MAEGGDPQPTTSFHEAGDVAVQEAPAADAITCSLCQGNVEQSLQTHLTEVCTGECPFGCEGTGDGGLIGAHLNDPNYKEAHISSLLRGVKEINAMQMQESPEEVIDPEKTAKEKKFLVELDELDSRSQVLSSRLISTVSQLSRQQIAVLIEDAELVRSNRDKLNNVKEKIKHLAQKVQLLTSYDVTFKHLDAMVNRKLDKTSDLMFEITNLGSETAAAINEVTDELEELRWLPTDRQLVWRIDNVLEKMNHTDSTHYSQPFWDGVFGFQMRLIFSARNEKGEKVDHLRLGLQLLKGDYDSINRWPFNRQVTIRILNQNRGQANASKTLYKEIKDWRRVTDELRTYVIEQYISLGRLCHPENGFVKDEVMFVEATVSDPVDDGAGTSGFTHGPGPDLGASVSGGNHAALTLRQGLLGGSAANP